VALGLVISREALIVATLALGVVLGALVAIGETTGVVRVWDAETGIDLAEFTGHAGLVFPTFNADGTKILTSGDDGTARIFSCELCRPLPELLELSQERLTRGLTSEERAEFL